MAIAGERIHAFTTCALASAFGRMRSGEFGFRVSGSRVGEFRAWSGWSLGFRAEGLVVQDSDKRPDGVGLQV